MRQAEAEPLAVLNPCTVLALVPEAPCNLAGFFAWLLYSGLRRKSPVLLWLHRLLATEAARRTPLRQSVSLARFSNLFLEPCKYLSVAVLRAPPVGGAQRSWPSPLCLPYLGACSPGCGPLSATRPGCWIGLPLTSVTARRSVLGVAGCARRASYRWLADCAGRAAGAWTRVVPNSTAAWPPHTRPCAGHS